VKPSASRRPTVLRGDGVVLREWLDTDLPAMVELFDEPSIDAWTPLESPFDHAAATRYLARARAVRDSGKGLQLAITADGGEPLGEVLMYPREDGSAELAYAVGVRHRGHRFASRALRLLCAYAAGTHGIGRFVLCISPANVPSQHVATAGGFRRSNAPREVRELKGRRAEFDVWTATAPRTFTAPGRDSAHTIPRDHNPDMGGSDMPENTYRVTEIVGSSGTSIDEAIRNGVERASKTLRNLDWFEVTQVRGHLEDGQIAHYQVGLKVGFRLEDV
jgi:flavin-binding protein dodecin/RimJ/RimL family protein N-acetyltransferase